MKHLKKQHPAVALSSQGDSVSGTDAMTPSGLREALAQREFLRTGFGVVLFVLWGIATIIWLYTNVHLIVDGHISALITALSALALLVLLGCMEGLEVSVIDRWQTVWPGKENSYLAGWLAARQLFVALIVTAATLLANRSHVFLPFVSAPLTGGFATSAFDLAWTTLTVLWFAQILPKHMAAKNPDRYLGRLRGPLFPVVHFVHQVGISQPGEWTAGAVERKLDWPDTREEAARHESSHGLSPGSIWRELPMRSALRKHRKPHKP
jgi:hypothetical protein